MSGTSSGSTGGVYYNVDTALACREEAEESSAYFLKCDAAFADHVRSDAYDTEEFRDAYPMAEEDYVTEEETAAAESTEEESSAASEGEEENSADAGEANNEDASADSENTDSSEETVAAAESAQSGGLLSAVQDSESDGEAGISVASEGDADTGEEADAAVSAASTDASDFTYSVLNGTYCSITGYSGTETAITIPTQINGYIVQEIEASAFKNNTTIVSVTISSTVELIDSSAFYGCTSLESVTVGDSVTSIESNAFYGCTSLVSADLGSSVTEIGSKAFYGCSSLTEVSLSETLTTIGNNAFSGCTSLTTLELPDSVTTLGYYVFDGCTGLTSINYPAGLSSCATTGSYYGPFAGSYIQKVTVPEGASSIAAYTFGRCTTLTGIEIPGSVNTIGNRAFYGCTGLASVTLAAGLTSIGSNAFYGCTGLTALELPETLTSLGSYAFSGCSGLSSLSVPEGVASLPSNVFEKCTGLTSVTLPAGLTSIGNYAFTGCTGLTTLELPDSVTTLGYYIFNDCTSLKEINYPTGLSSCETTGSYYGPFAGSSIQTVTVPEGVTSITSYTFGQCTSLEEIMLPASVGTIDTRAFYNCTGLTSVTFSEGLTSIGSYAFYGCASLKELALPETLETLGSYAFAGSSGLGSLSVPEKVTSLPNNVCENCTGLTTVSLPETLTSIGNYAFSGCTGLTTLELPDNVTTLGYYVFNGCTNLTSVNYPKSLSSCTTTGSYYGPFAGASIETVTIPDGVTAIPSCTFSQCTSLKTIVLPDSVTTIGERAFYGCTGLESVTLPAELTEIGSHIFDGCSSLSDIELPSTLTSIGNYAFYGCTGLSELTTPESLTSIGSYAYANCIMLRRVTFNEKLTSIGSYAFSGCTGLVSLVLNDGLETISASAFANCTNLTAVTVPDSVTSIGSNVFSNCSKLTIYCNSGSTAYSTAMSAGYTCYQLDEHEHDYEVTLETSATCTRAGSQILTCSICGYNYIEVLEALGHDYADTVTDPTCTKKGYTTHVCSRCGDTYTDSYVAATGHTYGDWTVTTEATLLAEGVQTRTCSVCGEEETEAIAKLSVDYGENSDYGLANFTIVDATTLKAIPNACLFISTDDDGEATLVADENGKISQVLPVGKWSVSVYAEGYQPRTLKVTIKAGEQDIATIGISESQLVDATVTTTEMTYEEMVEAGINVDASSNHQYYKYSVTITFTATLDVMSLITYTDEEGTVVATSSTSSTASSRTYYALSHDGADVEAEAVKLIYSSEHGTYILDSDVTESSVWTPTGNEAMTLSNGGYYAEGYGIPSELHMNSSLTFSDSGWEYSDGVLSMDTGSYVHYLTYCEGTFCTVSSADDAATMQLFVQETVDWFDDETVVWVPAEELTAGTEYLIVQKSSVSTNNRYALSHAAEKPDAEKVRVYGDDTYGNYISDSSSLDSAVWTMSGSDSALTFCNNEYYPQVDTELATLYFDNVLEALDWNYDGGYLYTTIGEETYYLRYNNGYTVTNDRRYAGPVTLYEKTAVTDDLNAEKIIYKAVDGYEDGKEYIIVGSSRAPASSSGGGSIYYAGGGDDTNSVSGTLSDGTTVTVYPVSEKFYLIIYGECSWLKEMYDVEMLIVNNSLTDTLEDCTAELLLPDGLSLAEMNDGEQSSVQTVDYIEEGGSESLHWYVRGDEEGTYNVTATLAGMMMPHEEEFYYEFEANSPIKVYAGSAMQMTFHIPEAAYNGMDYIVTIELENVSNKVIYGIRHAITGWEAGKITYYSDGTEETTVYADEGYLGSISTDEFYPGDKIVIELSLPILFESSLIESLEEAVDGFESLYNSYKALKASYDALSAITSFCKGASKSLDSVIKSSSSSMDSTKAKATSDLLEAVNKLLSKYEEGDSEALKYVTKIQGTDLYETLEKLASETDCTAFLAASDAATIAALAVKFGSALGEDEDESDGSSGRGDSEESGSSESEDSSDDDFNVFDSLRTLLTMIPMRYVVDNVIVSTLEGSTTEIPYTVELTPVESSFFGVNNLGKYLYNLTIAGMGKISAPLPYDIIGDFDDLTGYEDAVAYVKQTESAMEAYTVSGNADATFRAWIERSSSASGISLASESDDNAFTLETANETAEYDENGVLTFTGSAVLDVTANTTEGGTLYVEDVASGCVKSFVIDVVEEHTCSSDTWVTVLSPTDEYDGYRAKYCDTCGDVIGVEIITACEEHSYGDAVVTQEATCAQAGVQYRVCETCGGIQYEYLDPTGHTVETWTIETEATCTEEGSQTGTCTVCGETVTETIEATGHVYEESYQSDASGHWQVCTVCEEDSEVEAHTYENGVCTVCGYYEIAEGNLAAGSCGGNLTWVLSEDGVLTVSGTGEMTSWTEESLAPWADYQAQITSVVIASGVTSIGDYAFYGCTNLTEISVATSVTTVGASAFEGCTSLMSVAISTAVTSVGERAYGYAVDETEPMEDFVIHGSTGSAAETYANSNNISFEDPDACVYNAPVFTWDGTTSCTATFVCGVCGESENVTCTVSSETTEATCTADGVTIYTAICTFEDETYTDTQKVIIPATGHSYGEPTFVWAEDYSSCAATFTCSAGDDTQTVDTTVTSETTEATCTEDGKIVYTATCTFESETYTDTQTVTLTATGHDYVAVVTEPTCTKDGYTTYTCSKCGDTYTADETEATGHSYGEPTFTWAEDHSSCTAT
ncbi:MAG: leucine-rich repeat protein, partial [Lachnospiraceae bacterium]|nr:leucine-rich repeat protein [Lachnospiraceae bacterium]